MAIKRIAFEKIRNLFDEMTSDYETERIKSDKSLIKNVKPVKDIWDTERTKRPNTHLLRNDWQLIADIMGVTDRKILQNRWKVLSGLMENEIKLLPNDLTSEFLDAYESDFEFFQEMRFMIPKSKFKAQTSGTMSKLVNQARRNDNAQIQNPESVNLLALPSHDNSLENIGNQNKVKQLLGSLVSLAAMVSSSLTLECQMELMAAVAASKLANVNTGYDDSLWSNQSLGQYCSKQIDAKTFPEMNKSMQEQTQCLRRQQPPRNFEQYSSFHPSQKQPLYSCHDSSYLQAPGFSNNVPHGINQRFTKPSIFERNVAQSFPVNFMPVNPTSNFTGPSRTGRLRAQQPQINPTHTSTTPFYQSPNQARSHENCINNNETQDLLQENAVLRDVIRKLNAQQQEYQANTSEHKFKPTLIPQPLVNQASVQTTNLPQALSVSHFNAVGSVNLPQLMVMTPQQLNSLEHMDADAVQPMSQQLQIHPINVKKSQKSFFSANKTTVYQKERTVYSATVHNMLPQQRVIQNESLLMNDNLSSQVQSHKFHPAGYVNNNPDEHLNFQNQPDNFSQENAWHAIAPPPSEQQINPMDEKDSVLNLSVNSTLPNSKYNKFVTEITLD